MDLQEMVAMHVYKTRHNYITAYQIALDLMWEQAFVAVSHICISHKNA